MKCVVCREREAQVPDRERMGRLVKRVCRECHAERLRGDVRKIAEDNHLLVKPRVTLAERWAEEDEERHGEE